MHSTYESSFDQYTQYIEVSDVFLKHYHAREDHFDNQFRKIQNWINKPLAKDQLNPPFLIKSPHAGGVKELLSSWYNYHKQLHRKHDDIVIMHFGSTKQSYFEVIYKTLIKLRYFLEIDQKVQLQGEKLRTYLKYWLNLSHRYIENQVINTTDVTYNKIIIILESIDQFVDSFNGQKQANVSLWLPQYFPANVKVIVTAQVQSQAIEYFLGYGCECLTITIDSSFIQRYIQSKESSQVISHKQQQIVQYIRSRAKKSRHITMPHIQNFLSILLQEGASGILADSMRRKVEGVDLESFDYCESVLDFLKNLIKQLFKRDSAYSEKFIGIMTVMVCAQKGLTLNEIMIVTKCTQAEFKEFEHFLLHSIIRYKGLIILVNQHLTKLIYQIVPPSKIYDTHAHIAEALSKTPNSVRKLEELTHQLFRSHNFLKLKEVISDVQNLLLLFSPENKFALCRYWQELEKNNFDPVHQYNKAVEGFLMHFHPSSEHLFLIIVQVSRFLKEFADFQTYNTLSYRHPSICGNTRELAQIRIFDELKALHICDEEDNVGEIENVEMRVNKLVQSLRNQRKVPNLRCTGALQRSRRPLPPTFMETNIEIQSNRQKFRAHYVQKIKEMMQDEVDRNRMDRELTQVQSLQLLIQQNMQFSYHETINYYYKRWIWMQFPWVCISLKCDYSDRMRRCSTSPTEYMSVKQETKLTFEALKIALEAKLKNQIVLEQKIMSKQELLGFKFNKKVNPVTTFYRPKPQPPNLEKIALYNPRDYLKIDKLFKQKSNYRVKPKSLIKPQESTIISFYLTQSHPDFEEHITSTLPTINKRTIPMLTKAVSNDRQKNLRVIEQHNVALKKCYNELRAQNEHLSKKLNKLKIMEYNELNQRKMIKQTADTKNRIADGQARRLQITRDFAYSLIQQERLMILIKVCKDNVTNNEESIKPLINESNNFKAMIRIEKEELRKLNTELERLKKIRKQVLSNIHLQKDTDKNFKLLLNDTLSNMRNFDSKVSQLNSTIKITIDNEKARLVELQKSSKVESVPVARDMEKRDVKLSSELEDIRGKVEKLCLHFQVDPEEDFFSCQQYRSFLSSLEEKEKIEAQKINLEEQRDILRQEIHARDLNMSSAEDDERQGCLLEEQLTSDSLQLSRKQSREMAVEQQRRQISGLQKQLKDTFEKSIKCLSFIKLNC